MVVVVVIVSRGASHHGYSGSRNTVTIITMMDRMMPATEMERSRSQPDGRWEGGEPSSLLFGCRLCRLLLTFLLLHTLNDADSHRLLHVAHREPAERWILGVCLHAHRLARYQLHYGRVTRLHALGRLLDGFACPAIDLLLNLVELAGDVGRVAVEHWSVTVLDLPRVVHYDHLPEHQHTATRNISPQPGCPEGTPSPCRQPVRSSQPHLLSTVQENIRGQRFTTRTSTLTLHPPVPQRIWPP